MTRPIAPLPPPRDRIRAIVARVACAHNVSVAGIMSGSRKAGLVSARHAAIAAVNREFPNLSTTALGRFFGRHHTAILHALDRLGDGRKYATGAKLRVSRALAGGGEERAAL